RLRRGRGGRSDASRAANGTGSVSLRSKDLVEVRWARAGVVARLTLCLVEVVGGCRSLFPHERTAAPD
ncbi:hypothetical protein, partial [Nocardia sp. NPDC004750]